MVKTADAEPRPMLVGNVAQSDDRGGIATLVHRNESWVKTAIGAEQSPPRSARLSVAGGRAGGASILPPVAVRSFPDAARPLRSVPSTPEDHRP